MPITESRESIAIAELEAHRGKLRLALALEQQTEQLAEQAEAALELQAQLGRKARKQEKLVLQLADAVDRVSASKQQVESLTSRLLQLEGDKLLMSKQLIHLSGELDDTHSTFARWKDEDAARRTADDTLASNAEMLALAEEISALKTALSHTKTAAAVGKWRTMVQKLMAMQSS